MEYTRITLRIPTDLHEELLAAAGEKSRSMNAEIISRLRGSAIAPKFGFNGIINDLGDSQPFTKAQEARLKELIREALGK